MDEFDPEREKRFEEFVAYQEGRDAAESGMSIVEIEESGLAWNSYFMVGYRSYQMEQKQGRCLIQSQEC